MSVPSLFFLDTSNVKPENLPEDGGIFNVNNEYGDYSYTSLNSSGNYEFPFDQSLHPPFPEETE